MATQTYRTGPLSIFSVTRKNNSTNGNPTWELHISKGNYTTQLDASLGYGIENYTNSRHPETYCIGNDVPEVTLITARAGRVCYIEKNGEVLH